VARTRPNFLGSKGFLPFAFFLLLGILSRFLTQSLLAENSFCSQGAVEVRIPSFGPDGKISWELEADEVMPAKSSHYFVKQPNLKMITNDAALTKASSDVGIFDLSKGTARGDTELNVLSNLFQASGNKWSWQEVSEKGSHQLTFASDAYVYFKSEIEPVLAKPAVEKDSSPKKKTKIEKTVANADVMEFFAIKKGGYRFILDGNVSINGESLEIKCMKMEILVEQDQNKSEMSYGRISEVRASGNVLMKQLGRICRADSLILDTINGKGLLEGNAKVEDAEWGLVTGKKVELDRETGKARVLGDKSTRPRLELPNMRKIKLPGFKK
jgi:lipopolysaccharide export system protein LptA